MAKKATQVIVGSQTVRLEMPTSSQIDELWYAVTEQVPPARGAKVASTVVNGNVVTNPRQRINPGDTVQFITEAPPKG